MNARYATFLATVLTCAAHAQLTGFYSVGGTNPNYATPALAFADLMAQGANGDVTFNIAPGTYAGQYALGTIPGTPGTITVKSATNNAVDVVLEFDAAFPLDNHILSLDGVANLRLEDITLQTLNNDRARAIHFFNNTDNLKLWDCIFIGSQSTSTNSYFDRILVQCDQNTLNTPDNADDLSIIGCEFRYGNEAIDLDAEGSFGARAQGVVIAENTFTDQVGTGVYIQNAIGEFSANRMTTTVGNGFVGLRTAYFDGGSKVQRNVFQLKSTIYGTEGIEVGNTQSTTDNVISNNMITVEGPGENWGIAVSNLWGMSVVYNSVAVLSGSATSKAFFHLSNFPDGQDVVIRDNIFANYSGGPALESSVAGNIVTEDHNDLFTNGTNVASTGGTNYATLAAYQSGTSDGAGDLDLDPAFPFLPDLHLNSCVLDDVGEYFYVPAGDIDYEARGNPVSDIGADEYTYSSGTVSIIVDLDLADVPYTLTAPNGSNYLWSQGSTAQSVQVNTAGPYFCEVTDVNGCTYTVNWIVNINFSTGVVEQGGEGSTLFPNPATETITIRAMDPRARLTVVDANGRVVMQASALDGPQLDVRALPPGLYLLCIRSGAELRTARFVKR